MHDEMTLFNLRWKRFISWDKSESTDFGQQVPREPGMANSTEAEVRLGECGLYAARYRWFAQR